MTSIGLGLPQLGHHVTADIVRRFSMRAEELGYASLWAQDHVFYPLLETGGYAALSHLQVPPQYESVFSPLELLTFVAACTERVSIGTSTLVAGYHTSVRLAQQLATLDVLSEGRLLVGLGAGWSAPEHALFGVDMPTRWDRLEELAQALRACWGPDPVEFEGTYFSVPRSIVRPKPWRAQGPPLLGAVGASPGSLRRVHRTFDGWNPGGLTVSQVVDGLAHLAALGDDGAPPLDVHCRVMLQKPQTREDALEDTFEWCFDQVAQARDAGFTSVILDASFWHGIEGPESWLEVPELFLPALVG